MSEDNENIIPVPEDVLEEEKSDIDEVREKYEGRNSDKPDEIIAFQAVICILLTAGFFIANIFYPQICRELFNILERLMKDTQHIVPYISDYL
ncbi:MAG: hypothetical protein SPE43_07630 [Ruminococcus sp.]|nr:hypothetical protein [Oscillospiraceae bacterium]MDY4414216.1 hypothetical protein [Ruminococcus sp.]